MNSQVSIFEIEKDVRRQLAMRRLREIKNHLPYELRFKKSKILSENIQHQNFYKNFFAYWDL